MLEPIAFGVPEIVKIDDWSIGMLGEFYPFFVSNEEQGYALINKFVSNYALMYSKFEEWFATWFMPTYTKRMTEDNLYKNCLECIRRPLKLEEVEAVEGMKNNEVVQLLMTHGQEEFEIPALIKKLGEEHLRTLAQKVDEEYDARGLVWGTPWNDFRIALKYLFGYEDASVKLGHLKRGKDAILSA